MRAASRPRCALGAAGVQVGTAYLLAPEATTSAVHRARAEDRSRARHRADQRLHGTSRARAIVNRLVRELGPMSSAAPAFPLAASAIAAAARRPPKARAAATFSPLWAGQNTSGCREVAAAVITRELAAGLG
jgi:nitronate monooxygenase